MPATQGKLTERQQKFARLLATEPLSQTEAARKAGYSTRTANRIAHSLTKIDSVNAKIGEYRAKADAKALVTYESHIAELTAATQAALADKAYGPAINAIKAKGQVSGLYDRSAKPLEELGQLTLEAMMQRLSGLLQSNPDLAAISQSIVIDGVTETKPSVTDINGKPKQNGKRRTKAKP